MNSAAWKTAIVMLVLLTAGPAAILLYNGLRADAEGGTGLGQGTTNSESTSTTPTPTPLVCPGGERFEIRNASVDAGKECCTTSIVGQITNNCNAALVATVAGALRLGGSGRILAVSNADKIVGTLGPGETTFFRIDLSGKAGWDASQRRDMAVDVQARASEPEETGE
jgi:hypothetical protein